MIRELKYVFLLFTIFFFFFFVVKFYFSETNVRKSNRILTQYKNRIYDNFNNLPIIKKDTNNVIEFNNLTEDSKKNKQRKYWDLIK